MLAMNAGPHLVFPYVFLEVSAKNDFLRLSRWLPDALLTEHPCGGHWGGFPTLL